MRVTSFVRRVERTRGFSSSGRFLGIARVLRAPRCPLLVLVVRQLPSSGSLSRLRSGRSGETARRIRGAEARGIGGSGRLHDLLPDLPDLQLQTQLGGKDVGVSGLEGCRGLSCRGGNERDGGLAQRQESGAGSGEGHKSGSETYRMGKSPVPETAA